MKIHRRLRCCAPSVSLKAVPAKATDLAAICHDIEDRSLLLTAEEAADASR